MDKNNLDCSLKRVINNYSLEVQNEFFDSDECVTKSELLKFAELTNSALDKMCKAIIENI